VSCLLVDQDHHTGSCIVSFSWCELIDRQRRLAPLDGYLFYLEAQRVLILHSNTVCRFRTLLPQQTLGRKRVLRYRSGLGIRIGG
jgi:hypothetical protein